jgi:hypothetical protein
MNQSLYEIITSILFKDKLEPMALRNLSRNKHRKKSQIAAEFTILLGFALLLTMVSILFLYTTGKDRTAEKIDYKMYDFGSSLQNEFILASQMNDGYVRTITLNDKIEQTAYNISIISQKAIQISYNDRNIYFKIPEVQGSLIKGINTIRTVGDDIQITQ